MLFPLNNQGLFNTLAQRNCMNTRMFDREGTPDPPSIFLNLFTAFGVP
jgi:hypothetical protein